MKQNYLKKLMTALLLLCCTVASAHDFVVGGIYYKFKSQSAKTVVVTYRGVAYSQYNDEYSGDIIIPSSVTYKGAAYKVVGIQETAFRDCISLKSVTIPSSVINIGYEAFLGCDALKRVKINNGGLTDIGHSAFQSCDVLDDIVIPSSVINIGYEAFWGCALKSVEIPDGVVSIGNSAFASCPLESIVIPSSVTNLGRHPFHNCSSLKSIIVNENNTVYDSRNNCNAIIETATNTLITGCENTIIPNNVESIGHSAFHAVKFESVVIPNSVKLIDFHAFSCCHNLKKVIIPNSVTTLEGDAFSSCENLTSVEIPNSVTSIGEYAFNCCYGLKSITSYIPADKLFVLGKQNFGGVNTKYCILYVPAGAKEAYAAMEQWKDFKNIVELEPEGHSLAVSAAGYATMYLDKAVEIPAGVEAYTAGRTEGDYLKMQAVEDVIPANTAVIIKAEEGNYSFAYSDETPDAIEGNLLRGTLTDTYIKPAGAQSAYVLSVVDGVVGMYRAKLKADGTFKNNANRVYMLLGDINVGKGDLDTSNPGGQLSNGYRFDFSGTTAIEGIESESAAPAVYYDLSGRRVENPTKGIYIVNGRKVFIK